jgi:hypothetical protein
MKFLITHRRRDTRKGVLGIIGGLLRHIKKLHIDKLFLETKNAFLNFKSLSGGFPYSSFETRLNKHNFCTYPPPSCISHY